MAIVIYTYSNPYKINQEPYWAMVKNSFQYYISLYLQNGRLSSERTSKKVKGRERPGEKQKKRSLTLNFFAACGMITGRKPR